MCGICGIIDKTGRYHKQSLQTMNDTLFNRGPDGEGLHWENGIGMAMRRLSIIDLESGWRPIFRKINRFW